MSKISLYQASLTVKPLKGITSILISRDFEMYRYMNFSCYYNEIHIHFKPSRNQNTSLSKC